MLKTSAPCISFPLTYIFNKVMITGIFPSRLKYALIKPIFKSGDKKKIANYRPISLLPSLSKMIENIIYNRLMNHVTTNNILTPEQYGFRPSSSTEQATFNFINNILNKLQKKQYCRRHFPRLAKGLRLCRS